MEVQFVSRVCDIVHRCRTVSLHSLPSRKALRRWATLDSGKGISPLPVMDGFWG